MLQDQLLTLNAPSELILVLNVMQVGWQPETTSGVKFIAGASFTIT
jgi:hypothetical protein